MRASPLSRGLSWGGWETRCAWHSALNDKSTRNRVGWNLLRMLCFLSEAGLLAHVYTKGDLHEDYGDSPLIIHSHIFFFLPLSRVIHSLGKHLSEAKEMIAFANFSTALDLIDILVCRGKGSVIC